MAFRDTLPDFSHANLGWIAEDATFLARAVGSTRPIHIGLRTHDFSLVILDADACQLDAFLLEGKTLDEGYAWVAMTMERLAIGAIQPHALHRPEDDFPEHPVKSGAPFTCGDPVARAEFARWYSNTLLLLSEVARVEPGASEVRTWPHHFDMATLITIEDAAGSENRRSIGVGLSPGDADYEEPYFYATPWPYPEHATLAGRGLWHMTGWTGAVLKGSRLVDAADGALQLERARKFLASAIPAGRRLAGA